MVRELTSEGIAVAFIKERLTFRGNDTPVDTLMLTMLDAFAALERVREDSMRSRAAIVCRLFFTR